MDNLTHSLVGVVLGAALARKDKTIDRKTAIWTAVLGSNLPDLDALCTLDFSGRISNLDYLLIHRGWTHTLALSFPLALVATGLGLLFSGALSSKKRHLLTQAQFWKLSFLALVSLWFHTLADSCNNYGVHPLSPVLNRWFYGDFIYIIEPFILLALIPFGIFISQKKSFKIILIGVVFALIVAAFTLGLVPIPMGILLAFWGTAFAFLQKRFKNEKPAIVGVLTILAVFFIASQTVKSRIKSTMARENPGFQAVQWSASPSPANPFCWFIVTVGVENQQSYLAKAGVFSLLPNAYPWINCFKSSSAAPTSPVAELTWMHEFKKPLEEFTKLRSENCRFNAFLSFSRIPTWRMNDPAQPGIFTAEDLRYSQLTRAGFSKMDLSPELSCPSLDYCPWTPPTHEIR